MPISSADAASPGHARGCPSRRRRGPRAHASARARCRGRPARRRGDQRVGRLDVRDDPARQFGVGWHVAGMRLDERLPRRPEAAPKLVDLDAQVGGGGAPGRAWRQRGQAVGQGAGAQRARRACATSRRSASSRVVMMAAGMPRPAIARAVISASQRPSPSSRTIQQAFSATTSALQARAGEAEQLAHDEEADHRDDEREPVQRGLGQLVHVGALERGTEEIRVRPLPQPMWTDRPGAPPPCRRSRRRSTRPGRRRGVGVRLEGGQGGHGSGC